MVECGLVWMAHAEDGFEAASAATMAAQGIPCERLDPAAGDRMFPSFGAEGLAFLLHEPEAGVLRAQRATRALARRAAAHGATVVRAARGPGRRPRPAGRRAHARGRRRRLGVRRVARRAVPREVAIRSTRQELFFFDGGPAWAADGVPAFVDFDHAIYGTRDLDGLGVKAAPDFDGPPLAPDAELPPATGASERLSRAFLASASPRSRTRRSPARVLPLRAHARRPFRRRPAARAGVRVAARRRLRPRLQARPGARRGRRRRPARRRAAARAVRARAARHARGMFRTAGATG